MCSLPLRNVPFLVSLVAKNNGLDLEWVGLRKFE